MASVINVSILLDYQTLKSINTDNTCSSTIDYQDECWELSYDKMFKELQVFDSLTQAKDYICNENDQIYKISQSDVCIDSKVCTFPIQDIKSDEEFDANIEKLSSVVLVPNIFDSVLTESEFAKLFHRDVYGFQLLARIPNQDIQQAKKLACKENLIQRFIVRQIKHFETDQYNTEEEQKQLWQLISKMNTIIFKRLLVNKSEHCALIRNPIKLERLASRAVARLVNTKNLDQIEIAPNIKEMLDIDIYFRTRLVN